VKLKRGMVIQFRFVKIVSPEINEEFITLGSLVIAYLPVVLTPFTGLINPY
jgi:hypothetical protein